MLGLSGCVVLPSAVADAALRMAREDFDQAQENEFSGDSVRDYVLPAWLPEPAQILPAFELGQAGVAISSRRGVHMYATCGVDPHVDDMDGLSVCMVLHSDGFVFKQGKIKLKLSTGDWFIFDDRLLHSVVESKHSTSLVVITGPVLSIGSASGAADPTAPFGDE